MVKKLFLFILIIFGYAGYSQTVSIKQIRKAPDSLMILLSQGDKYFEYEYLNDYAGKIDTVYVKDDSICYVTVDNKEFCNLLPPQEFCCFDTIYVKDDSICYVKSGVEYCFKYNSQLTEEQVQDIVGLFFEGSVTNGIYFSYNDEDNNFEITNLDGSPTNELSSFFSQSSPPSSMKNGDLWYAPSSGVLYLKQGVYSTVWTQADWNMGTTTDQAYIKNKPNLSNYMVWSDTLLKVATLYDLSQIADTDNQTLSKDSTAITNGKQYGVTISGGNRVTITDTKLTETEVDNYVSNNGYLLSEVDGSISNELQDLILLDSINRVFRLQISSKNTVKWKDLNPIDSTALDSGYGIYAYEVTPNNWKIEADTNEVVTPYDLTQVDQSSSNELQTLSADSTATTIGITTSINNSRVHFNVLKSEVDGSTTNEKISNFTLSTGGQLKITEGGTDWTVNSLLYGGSSLGANYLPIWAGGQNLTNYWGYGTVKVMNGLLSTYWWKDIDTLNVSDGLVKATGKKLSSITDNSTNWNTAYSWGNHASAGYLTSQTSHADVVVDGDFTSQGLMKRGASSGTYSIIADNSSNWNTAYSWSDWKLRLGANTTSGTLDWNDATNARPGTGETLLLGNATNGFGVAGKYYHAWNLEYSSKDATGNIFQMAYPYYDGGIRYRARYSGTWNAWKQIWTSEDFANNSTNWNTAYDKKINSLAFSGTTTKTLTLTYQDGNTISNTFTDNNSGGTVTSITATSPLTGGTITLSGNIGIQTASGSQAGAISSTDWALFNGKIGGSGATDRIPYFSTANTLTSASTLTRNATTGDIIVNNVTVGKGGGTISTNVALGASALASNTTGSNNFGLGMQALYNNTTGVGNVALGQNSLFYNNGSYNIGIGQSTLQTNSSGSNNIGIGSYALYLTTGSGNIAIGSSSMQTNAGGNNNTAIGNTSLYYNTSGSLNSFVGYYAGVSNTTGSGNVGFGTNTLFGNQTGNYNVAIGYNAGYQETGSQKLYIENSNSASPLIGGNFSTDRVGINTNVASLAATLHVTGNILSTDLASGYNRLVYANSAGAQLTTTGTGYIKGNGTTFTYDNSTFQTTSLTDGKIRIGNGSNLAAEQTMSGDATMTNTGVVTITPYVEKATSAATQSITDPANGWIKLTLDANPIDNTKITYSNTNDDLTVTTAGNYKITWSCNLIGTVYLSDFTAQFKIYKNGSALTDIINKHYIYNADDNFQHSEIYTLAANDYIDIRANTSSSAKQYNISQYIITIEKVY